MKALVPNRRNAGAAIAAAALAVLAAAGAGAWIYVSGGEGGNADTTAAACAPAVRAAAALDPLATGEVAAFRIADKPLRLDALAFTAVNGQATTVGAAGAGRVTLLNLWATWCGPCRKEMPALDRLQSARGGADFGVLPVSIDTGDPARPRDFLASIGVATLPVNTDHSTQIFQSVKERGLALGLPVTLLLDRKACLLGHMNGPAEWDSPDGRALIEAAVKATLT